MKKFLGYCLATITLASCLDEAKVDPAKPATFVRYINGGNADEPKALEKAKDGDGGYIVLANTRWPDGAAFIDRIKLVKVDLFGTVIWTKILPESPAADIGYKGNGLSVKDDGSGYIITGELINGTKTDLLILRTDAEGNEIKDNPPAPAPAPIALPTTESLGATPDDVQVSGRASWILDNDTYLVLGSVTGISKNMTLAKISYNSGNPSVAWDFAHGSGTSTLLNKMFAEDNDLDGDGLDMFFGGTVVEQGNSNNTALRLVRAVQNSAGTKFDLPYGNADLSEQANGICKTNSGYALIGSTNLTGRLDREILFTRIDKSGGLISSKTIPVTYINKEDTEVLLDEEGNSVCNTIDNGYIILATITSSITENGYIIGRGEKDYYLIKTDGFGDVVWRKAFGSKRNDIGVAVLQADDGGYMILGQTSLANVPTITLIKTNGLGEIQ
jgi:hypothetical protein